jgi:drug/metabolite transporter (DMT)-like permease
MKSRDWLNFIILGLIWGSSFMWIKIAVADVSPFVLVTFRVFFAVLGITGIILLQKGKIPLEKHWIGVFAFLGLFNVAVPFFLISWSEQFISSGIASVLNGTVALWTIIFAAIFLPDEKMSWLKFFGVVLGFGGVVVLSLENLEGGIGNAHLGVITMLIATASYGASNIFGRLKTRGLESNAQAFGQLTAAFIFVLPAALIIDPEFELPNLAITWFGLVSLGLLNTAVATWLYYSLLNSVGSTRTSMVGYLMPLVGVIVGVIFLHEKVSWLLLVGGLMIVAGVLLVNSAEKIIDAFKKQREPVG